MQLNILAIGDVVGTQGCGFLRRHLPQLKKIKGVDVCIANAENSAAGNGITPDSAQYLFDSGVDFLTTGNHVFRRKEVYTLLEENPNIVRPANFPPMAPGHGTGIIDLGAVRIGVVNLLGMSYMQGADNPFLQVDALIESLREDCRVILVDFHAEATAEKRAMGFYLDGRVSAIWGTHTHVLTADEQILPKGTGYITDIGMTGPVQSVLGVKPEIACTWLKSAVPARFDVLDTEDCMLNGCLFCVDTQTGKTLSAERIHIQ